MVARVGNRVVSEIGLYGRGCDRRDVTVHGSSCACRQTGFVESTASVTSLHASLIISTAAGWSVEASPGGRGPRLGHGAHSERPVGTTNTVDNSSIA